MADDARLVGRNIMALFLLFKKNLSAHRGTLAGITVLFFIISCALVNALTVLVNSRRYVREEMNRMGYGDMTVWVSAVPDYDRLQQELNAVDAVAKTGIQPLIRTGYSVNGRHSDDEGQLIAYSGADYPYKFLSNTFSGSISAPEISRGDIYISPAMKSTYAVSVGDTIHFDLSREGDEAAFTVKGYFEDPFMGSSMIDMKSFLISKADYDSVSGSIARISDFNILAKPGAMIHLFQKKDSTLSPAAFITEVNRQTTLGTYTEFMYTGSSIYGFMLLLQNMLAGFTGAFVMILCIVALVVISYSISNSIDLERKDMGILKTTGFTTMQLRTVQLLQYTVCIAAGMLAALFVSLFTVRFVFRRTVTSSGLLMPSSLPAGGCLAAFVLILSIIVLFIFSKTEKIAQVSPVQTIRNETGSDTVNGNAPEVRKEGLLFHIAVRALLSGKRRYAGTCIVSVLLVFFVSVVGRMNAWLGPDGEGLMNEFSVAPHDLGVQRFSAVDMSEIEKIITSYASIKETYELAMQTVSVNGVDYTANVLDKPQWFHVLSGRICRNDNEILVTEFVAKDLGIRTGSTVTVTHRGQSAAYVVTGIYECANGMGANIGMARSGFARIGDVNDYIWCRHYILSDSSHNSEIMKRLQSQYRFQTAVHTNSWSGLEGIVATMHLLTLVMYVIVVLFVFIVVILTSGKLLSAEQRSMAVCKSIGFTSDELRLSFMFRFLTVAGIGAIAGTIISAVFADPLITRLFRLFGISEFRSSVTFIHGLLPPLFVTILFTLFAYTASKKIKKVSVTALLK